MTWKKVSEHFPKNQKKECTNEIEQIRKLSFLSGVFITSFYTLLKEHEGKIAPWVQTYVREAVLF
jgi:hypothetical protein